MPTYQLISTQTLGSNATSITLSSIPQTYTDLLLWLKLRDTQGGEFVGTFFNTFNNNTGNIYALVGGGLYNSSLNNSNAGPTSRIPWYNTTTASNSSTNSFANTYMYIPSYTSALPKSAVVRSAVSNNVSAQNVIEMYGGNTTSTSAISSIELASNYFFLAGSSVQLYGISSTV